PARRAGARCGCGQTISESIARTSRARSSQTKAFIRLRKYSQKWAKFAKCSRNGVFHLAGRDHASMIQAMSRVFEEFPAGIRLISSPHRVTAYAIIEFARAFDSRIFHLDPKSGERRWLCVLAARGRYTAAVALSRFAD